MQNVKFLFHCLQAVDPRHLFYKCSLTEQQAKGVLHALRLVNAGYKAEIPASLRQAEYPALVASLYEKREESNVLASQAGHFEQDLDKSKLEHLLDEQVARELDGVTLIQSVEEKCGEEPEGTRMKELFTEWRAKWREALIQSIEAEMKEIRAGKGEEAESLVLKGGRLTN